MTEELEEEFRAACSAYLTAAEHWDRSIAEQERITRTVQAAQVAADRARDQLLQVVRERDAAGQLDAGEGRVQPSDRARVAREKWLTANRALGQRVTWMTPQKGSQRWHDMVRANICPECGVPWDDVSDECPKRVWNKHPIVPIARH